MPDIYYCKKNGKQKKQVNIIVEATLYDRIKKEADSVRLTPSAFIGQTVAAVFSTEDKKEK